jgi:hypothetical protein
MTICGGGACDHSHRRSSHIGGLSHYLLSFGPPRWWGSVAGASHHGSSSVYGLFRGYFRRTPSESATSGARGRGLGPDVQADLGSNPGQYVAYILGLRRKHDTTDIDSGDHRIYRRNRVFRCTNAQSIRVCERQVRRDRGRYRHNFRPLLSSHSPHRDRVSIPRLPVLLPAEIDLCDFHSSRTRPPAPQSPCVRHSAPYDPPELFGPHKIRHVQGRRKWLLQCASIRLADPRF